MWAAARAAMAAAVSVWASDHAAAAAAAPIGGEKLDASLWKAAQAAQAPALELLRQAVNIDSGTGDREGATAVQALFASRLQALGGELATVPSEKPGVGDNLVATFRGRGRGNILIVAHVDTVFPSGVVAARPFRTDASRAYGPGVSDEKGGGVTALTALSLLHAAGRAPYARLTLLLEASEETGSPGARALILRLSRDNDVELNMEPGDAPDAVTVWRKGSTTYRIEVHGRAAHAGVAPQDGRNAAVELMHQLQGVDVLPHSGPGVTANLTTLRAGDRVNVIPDLATASVNVRVRSPGQFAQVEAQLKANAQTTVVPETTVTVTSEPAFPPLPNNAGTDALAARARAIYAGLGRDLVFAGNGGASESALAASVGTPALDGLGPVGGGFHTDKEYLELSTLAPRIYLTAKLIETVGVEPPPRLPPS